ncbi:citrate synthase, partial [Myxococcota bacterium]|nr:citrate synthase [Myxococcota bacterium]
GASRNTSLGARASIAQRPGASSAARAGVSGVQRPSSTRSASSVQRPGVSSAELVLGALGVRPSVERVAAVELALVVSADHELNASTFAARVAASAGADLYACLTAAIATMSGPAHGSAPDVIEALVAELGRPDDVKRAVRAKLARGEPLPGFGHPLYPEGDPRGRALVERARALGAKTRAAETALALVDALVARDRHPSLDAGLVCLARTIGLPRGSASVLFALGRTAGWVAHVLEQRRAGFLLRPRARFVGGAAIGGPPE